MRRVRSHAVPLALLLIATLLPLVAVLQYRWIGSLSELEGQRMARTLRAATESFGDDLDDTLTGIFQAVHLDGARGDDSITADLAGELAEWRESAEDPGLIAEVLWVTEAPGDEQELRRFDPDAPGFAPAAWPEWLADQRRAMADDLDELSSDRRDRRERRRPRADPLHPEVPALLILEDEVRPPAFAVVLLDGDLLIGKLIPGWAHEYFTAGETLQYDVLVVDRGGDGGIVYASRPGLEIASFAEPDQQERMFGLRTGASRWDGRERRWEVLVRHRAGSLEAAVTAARLRSVAISFGALLLLAGSMVMLLLSTRRAQSLAVQQMDFVAGISHELRTPLAGISSLSQNLADGVVKEGEKVGEYGRAIHRESVRLHEMVETVLLFSKVQSGLARYERNPVVVADVVADVLRTLRNVPSLAAADAVVDLADDLPDVYADAGALKAALRNVVVNALKFNRGGEPIVVSASAADRGDRRRVQIAVTDHGCGIDADELARVTEPFYRGRAARDGQIEGSGLGLSIVKEVVEAQGGKVTIESEPGRGTTVVLSMLAVARRPRADGDRGLGQSGEGPRGEDLR